MFATLITGATGGLGNAFAKECAKRNHNLVLSGTNESKLNKLIDEIKANYSVFVTGILCDLSNDAERINLFSELKKQDIKIDFLINNAGYIIEGDFLTYSDETALKVVKVNCEGTLDITQKVIKQRDAGRELKVITISSQAGNYPMPHMALYSATKSFLTNFMIALNNELKNENVHITTICPSGIYTTKEMVEAIKAQGFMGKLTGATPEKIAKFSLKCSDKRKVYVVPKFINKFLDFAGRFASKKFIAKAVGNKWKKSQNKRGF